MTEGSRNIYMIARKAAGYTREHAAELLGVSCRCLADYEAGVRTPPNDIAESMVDVYRRRSWRCSTCGRSISLPGGSCRTQRGSACRKQC